MDSEHLRKTPTYQECNCNANSRLTECKLAFYYANHISM